MSNNRNKTTELIAFLVLIAGMSVAGYVYQINKDAISKSVLVPAIIGLLLVFYLIYRLMLRLSVKR